MARAMSGIANLLLSRAAASGGAPTTWTFTTSHSPYSGSVAPTQSNMSDGVTTGSYYGADTNATSWVKADFGSACTLTNVYLADAGGVGGWGETYLNGAVVAGSNDDSSWTTLATAASHTGDGAERTYAVTGSYRYVRVQMTSQWIALSQFRFS